MLKKFLLYALAIASAAASPIRPGNGACFEECVRNTIQPFVAAASEEGFRQSLGAHNTAETCMATRECRETLRILTEEITNLVFRDRTDWAVQLRRGRLCR